jgi:hypothetical protein
LVPALDSDDHIAVTIRASTAIAIKSPVDTSGSTTTAIGCEIVRAA